MSIEVLPDTPTIGAEIRGIDLTAEVTDAEIDAVRDALEAHQVVFFRRQFITSAQHLAFAQRFGPISVAPFGPKHPDLPEITVLDQTQPKGEGADNWHTDNTFMPAPPFGSILRCVQLPPSGGDTCFASGYAAHDALSAPMAAFLDGQRAVHDISRMLRKAISIGAETAPFEKMAATWPPHEHPVVTRHPLTGRRCLYVNGNWTARIVGLTERENDALLPMLIDHIRCPDFQFRLRWEPGTVVFWDNRWVQHFAVADYAGHRRVMERVTIAGEPPR